MDAVVSGRTPRTAALMCGFAVLALLSACSGEETRKREANEKATAVAKQLSVATDIPDEQGGVDGATPMKNRVAVLGLLNKRNGLVRELEIKPGEAIRVGKAIVRLRACEKSASWELASETGAFIQLVVQGNDSQWRRVFSGWLFKERPERNIIQHPIYDVFVKSCAMTYPGDPPPVKPAPAATAANPDGLDSAASSAPKSGAPVPAPAAAANGAVNRPAADPAPKTSVPAPKAAAPKSN